MGEACSRLSEEERRGIRIEIGNGTSIRRIGLMLGRNASTVGREIERDTWFPSNENESCRPYRPKRLKTGPWTGGCYIAPRPAQGRPQARQTAQAPPPVMRPPVVAGGGAGVAAGGRRVSRFPDGFPSPSVRRRPARVAVTCDDGAGFARRTRLRDGPGMDTCFADPYSSRRRGGDENRNGMIRRYPPERGEIRMGMAGELRELQDQQRCCTSK